MSRYSIGVDLGGSNLRLALYRDLERANAGSIEPLALVREPVGAERSPEAVVAHLARTIKTVKSDAGVASASVGVGFAGMFRGGDGFVAQSPHFGWYDVALGRMVREALAQPVYVDNDVNVIAYGEYRLGAARGHSHVLAVLVGTGIGGGIVADGRVMAGGSGCAAEIGHTKVVFGDDARPCHCGKRGCIEAYVGGENLRRRVREELAGRARSVAVERAGGPEFVEISDIDEAAAAGDGYALALYDEIGTLLGAALANAVTLLNPTCLVLGGGVLSRTPILKEHALAAMEVAVNPPALPALSVVDSALGDQAGLVGSALLSISSSDAATPAGSGPA